MIMKTLDYIKLNKKEMNNIKSSLLSQTEKTV